MELPPVSCIEALRCCNFDQDLRKIIVDISSSDNIPWIRGYGIGPLTAKAKRALLRIQAKKNKKGFVDGSKTWVVGHLVRASGYVVLAVTIALSI